MDSVAVGNSGKTGVRKLGVGEQLHHVRLARNADDAPRLAVCAAQGLQHIGAGGALRRGRLGGGRLAMGVLHGENQGSKAKR